MKQKYLIITLCLINSVTSDCLIDIKKDFGGPYNVLLLKARPSQFQGRSFNDVLYYPNQPGSSIKVPDRAEVYLSCPGKLVKLGAQALQETVAVPCLQGRFTVSGTVAAFDKFTCSDKVNHDAVETQRSCLNNARFKEVQIGFRWTDGTFLAHINLCFDTDSLTTLYSQTVLSKKILSSQIEARSSYFKKSAYYNVLELDPYKQKQQKITFLNLLDTNACIKAPGYEYYLCRGHLVANKDFVYANQQGLTFYLINVAPQWQKINNANWKRLEAYFKTVADASTSDFTLITGTFGVLQLINDKTKVPINMYLYVSPKGNKLPVPKYFWKAVVNQRTGKGVVCITSNDPFLQRAPQALCPQIQLNDPNLSLDGSLASGYTYCCNINDARGSIGSIPAVAASNVQGLRDIY